MAISNLRLNVTANTARALSDFSKFSRSLDNKFLVSGLKLDVVRNALGQINRDFQRAIGEQGLASASSLRAAQNQAALLTQTFKGFASESALAITRDLGTALNSVAVKAGGTMKDVQKALAATPFISTRLPEDLRKNLSEGIMAFQRDLRRGGIGDNFAGAAQQFLMGRASGLQMIESGNPLEVFLGEQIIKRAGGEGRIYDPLERSEILREIVNDPQLRKQLEAMAKQAMGFRIIFEDLNTYLFNTEKGVFGSLRKVVDAAGKPTTMFDEVEKLVKQVFDREEGMFAAIGKTIKKVFGEFDPLRLLINSVQFVTKVFKELTDYFNSSTFKGIVKFAKDIFDRVHGVFRDIFNAIKGMSSSGFDEDSIIAGIRDIGKTIREYIQSIGKKIRDTDTEDETGAIAGIAGTVLEEIGKSAVVLFKELLMTIINKVPEIAMQVLPALNDGINAILTEMFGELGGKVAKFILGFVPGPVGAIARASAVGDITGGGGNIGSMLMMGAGALLAPGALRATGGLARGIYRGVRGQVGGFALPFRYGYGTARGYSFPLDPRRGRTQYRTPVEIPEFDIAGEIGRRTREFNERQELLEAVSGRRRPPSRGGSRRPPGGGGGALAIGGPGIGFLSALSSLTRPRGFMRRLTDDDFDEFNVDTRNLGRPMYSGMGIGPQPDTVNNPAPGMSPLDPKFPWAGPGQPYMESRMLTPQEVSEKERFELDAEWAKDERSRRDVRRRFIQSRGGGLRGRRALLGAQMKRMGRGIRGFGKGALITGALVSAGALGLGIFGGPGANAQTFDPATGQMVPVARGGGGMDFSGIGSVAMGLGSGALTGAQFGSMLGPHGAAAGAVIGGIIGGIAPLLDKGVRDSIGKLVSDIGTRFSETADWFSKGFSENFTKFGKFLGEMLKGLGNALILAINSSISAFTLIPRLIITTVEALFNRLPEALKPDWAKGAINGIKSIANFQLPYYYSGKDYFGPAMSLEARMSGRKPMVVNDGEFVIPRDGFPILSNLVAQNLKGEESQSQPVQVSMTLNVTANSVVADADQLAEALRDPVFKILNDAWSEVTMVQRARVN